MFEPVPQYTHDCSKETASQLLNSFMKIVLSEANCYGINISNRFIAMLNCCDYLNQLMVDQKENLWKRPAKEPIPAFQDVFQLFIYALGDQGLLFNGIGNLYESPDIDYWEQSASAYHQLALAMRERNFAYLEMQSLKNLFGIRNNQQYLYGEPKKQPQTEFEVLQLLHLKEILCKANIFAADEILKNALTQMNNAIC